MDLTGKKNGHGAYVQKSEETILKAKKNKALAKALETEIPESVYDELLELVREK